METTTEEAENEISTPNLNFVERAIEKTPGWYIGIMGGLICMSLALNFANINFAEPINTISNAWAARVERRTQQNATVEELIMRLNEQEQKLAIKVEEVEKHIEEFELSEHEHIETINNRLAKLEAWSHRPRGKVKK